MVELLSILVQWFTTQLTVLLFSTLKESLRQIQLLGQLWFKTVTHITISSLLLLLLLPLLSYHCFLDKVIWTMLFVDWYHLYIYLCHCYCYRYYYYCCCCCCCCCYCCLFFFFSIFLLFFFFLLTIGITDFVPIEIVLC